jgi:protein-S-isoprenylcysteine O-methyltransferase Ste14
MKTVVYFLCFLGFPARLFIDVVSRAVGPARTTSARTRRTLARAALFAFVVVLGVSGVIVAIAPRSPAAVWAVGVGVTLSLTFLAAGSRYTDDAEDGT